MTTEDKTTFCRLCEQLCGLTVTVEDDAIVSKIRADRDHPLTHGFACPKGLSFNEIRDDPDRLMRPLRRAPDGTFEPVSWDAALTEIARKLQTIIDRHGGSAVGMYMGNPSSASLGIFTASKGFIDALGSPHFYTVGSQDTNSRYVASQFLYGSPIAVPVPDLLRTDLLVMVGANPLVSHGSLLSGGLVRTDMQDIISRGGRIVVVDPRQTETAERFEHLPVYPDGDAWLFASIIHVLITEDLIDKSARSITIGLDTLRRSVASFDPDATAMHSGVPADAVRALARDLAAAEHAVVYGRVGACVGGYSTLVNYLLDVVNALTGNLDRPGGAIFPSPSIDVFGMMRKQGLDSYGAQRTRVGGYPDVLGQMPAGVLAEEITTAGPGQLRALLVTAGNPVLTVPNSDGLARALDQLDLMVSLDIYINETNCKADYILPTTTFLEREDANIFVQQYQYRPFVQWTDAVVAPPGDVRSEWTILRDLSAKLGLVPSSTPFIRRLGPLGRKINPNVMFDLLLRTGNAGDWFGLRRNGLSRRRLLAEPRGRVLRDHSPTGVLPKVAKRMGGKVNIGATRVLDELDRLVDDARLNADERFPLRMFGRRELKSLNSWMHNSRRLNPRTKAPALLMHPDDAQRYGVQDSSEVVVETRTAALTVPLTITDEVMEGSVCLPHGFGHDGTGGWQRANATGGANANRLSLSGPGALEPIAAMSILNGIRVRVSAVARSSHE